MKSLPFYIPEAWKRHPFRAEPLRIGSGLDSSCPPCHWIDMSLVAPNTNPTRFVNIQLACLIPVEILDHVIFIWNCLFPLFKLHTWKLAVSGARRIDHFKRATFTFTRTTLAFDAAQTQFNSLVSSRGWIYYLLFYKFALRQVSTQKNSPLEGEFVI